MKGCTACYDLAAEFPIPTVEGLSAMAEAYQGVGMRCLLAPMVAAISFFEAIPGLMERLPQALRAAVESFRPAPWKARRPGRCARRCSAGASTRWRSPSEREQGASDANMAVAQRRHSLAQ